MTSDFRGPQELLDRVSGPQQHTTLHESECLLELPQKAIGHSADTDSATTTAQIAKEESPYYDLFELSQSGLALFEFLTPIDTSRKPELILDQVWLNNSRCLNVNQELLTIFGATHKRTILEAPLARLFPPTEKNIAVVREWIEKGFLLSRTETFEEGGQTLPRIVQISVYAKEVEHQIHQLWLVVKDISRSRIAAIAESLQEEHFHRLLEQNDVILLRVTPEGQVLYLSPLVQELVGLTVSEFKLNPQLLRRLLHPDDLMKYQRLMAARKNRYTDPLEAEYRLRFADGSYHWLHERQIPKLLSSGEVEYYDSVIFDIQQKKQLQAALGHTSGLQMVGTLAEGLAHSCKNYMSVILGQVNLALKELPPDSPGHARVEAGEKAALRCAEMLRQVLSFGRSPDFKIKQINTLELLTDTSELIEQLLPQRIKISCRIAAELYPINGDFIQLQQVLMNLATNARDAMPEGGNLLIEAKNVELGDGGDNDTIPAAAPGAYIEIAVSDTGCGIPDSHLAHVFDPFFSTKSKDHGSGLGLSMAYSIIKVHEGYIHIATRPKQGTRVVILLPALQQSACFPAGTGIAAATAKTESILVAEDDDMVRTMVETALRLHGYRVLSAADGKSALELFHSKKDEIDIVFADEGMPSMCGSDLISACRAEKPSLYGILTSGFKEDFHSFAQEKACSFLSKPYPLPKLLGLIRKLLDRE